MPKFRKKPVVIEARKVEKPYKPLVEWSGGYILKSGTGNRTIAIVFRTLEGEMWANLGDWIIKGVAGEFYPCKPEIFDATYEPVEEA